MQVQVHTDNKIQGGESLAQWIQEEATSRLGRFREYITRVEVFLSDVDAGKSGANDKRCRLEARPAGRQPVTVTGWRPAGRASRRQRLSLAPDFPASTSVRKTSTRVMDSRNRPRRAVASS